MTNGSTDLQVTDYWLNYRIATGTVRVWVKTGGNSGWALANEVPAEAAAFLLALLKSGQPVYYIPGVSLHSKDVGIGSPS